MLTPEGYNRRQRGVALVLVLWAIVLLTVMAASFALSTQRETALLHTVKQQAQATALAEAGIYYALMKLWQPIPEQQWRSDGTVYEANWQNSTIRVQIRDENGKVSLNQANEAMLKRLLEGQGLEEEDAQKVSDQILDWRDADDLTHPHGAEKDDYKDADLSYGPRNKVFQSLEELQFVLAVSPDLYQKLMPLVTVHAHSRTIDPTKASRPVLMALPGATEEIIDEYLQQRADSARDNTPLPAFPLAGAGRQAGSQSSGTVTISAQAKLPDGGRSAVSATIKYQRGGRAPFSILTWNQSAPLEASFKNTQAITVATQEAE